MIEKFNARTARFRFCRRVVININKDSEREFCGANVRFGAEADIRRAT